MKNQYETINTDIINDTILQITLNRPDKLNALNRQLFQELEDVFDQLPTLKNIKALLKDKCASLVAIDAMALAKEAGSPMSVNIVLLGALIESGSLGFTKENVIEAIKRRTKKSFLDKNLNAFELGFVAAQNYSS